MSDIATVQELCTRVPWTMSPATDLMAEIRISLGTTHKKAARLYRQAIEAGAIRQIHKVEVQPLPPGLMSKGGGLGVPTCLSKWEPIIPEPQQGRLWEEE